MKGVHIKLCVVAVLAESCSVCSAISHVLNALSDKKS